MQKAIAIVHARGGSKRIPLKNLQLVGDKPLIAYPIKLCQESGIVERIIVSTDHDGIMEAARKFGAEVPFRRPADISEDVPSEFVTLHAIEYLLEKGEKLPPYVITLTPATPFTKPEHLKKAFDLLVKNPQWESVTTAKKSHYYPEWTLRINEETGEAKTVLGNPMDGEFNVSQNLPKAFFPLGSFWINRIDRLLENRVLYGKKWGAIILPANEHIDIDTPDELDRARQMI